MLVSNITYILFENEILIVKISKCDVGKVSTRFEFLPPKFVCVLVLDEEFYGESDGVKIKGGGGSSSKNWHLAQK